MQAQKTLELNPRHPIVSSLLRAAQANPEDQMTKDMAMLLYDTALLASGFSQNETDEANQRVYRMMAKNFDLESMELEEEITVEEEEEAEAEAEAPPLTEEAGLGGDEF